MPSVTSILNTLIKKGLVNHEKYEYVELTPEGLRIAKDIAYQHEILFNFLKNILKIDAKIADEDACRMEHAISQTTLRKLIEFVEFIEICPRAGPDWLEYFNQYCKGRFSEKKCIQHMKGFIEEFSAKVKKNWKNKDGNERNKVQEM